MSFIYGHKDNGKENFGKFTEMLSYKGETKDKENVECFMTSGAIYLSFKVPTLGHFPVTVC
jgi:hypothetical protein